MKVLIVIDMQRDFVDGALGTPEAQAIVPAVAAKVKKYNEMDNGVIIYTKDTHFSNYMDTMEGIHLPVPHCIENTEGWEIVPEVYVEDSVVLDKYTFGRYNLPNDVWATAMIKYEGKELESIEVVGLCTDICVISNALFLRSVYPMAKIVVDAKCCAGTTPEQHQAALNVMKACCIEVINEN